MDFALLVANATDSISNPEYLLEFERARDFMTKYFQQYTAILAHMSLMAPTSTPSTASAWIQEDRLVIHAITAHCMSTLFLLAICLLSIVWISSPLFAFLPINPSSLLGTATILSQNEAFLEALRPLGASGQAGLAEVTSCWHYSLHAEKWCKERKTAGCRIQADVHIPGNDDLEIYDFKDPSFRPLSLHPAARSVVLFATCGIISVLEITLRHSQRYNGFGDAQEHTYIHYAWTVSPALVFSLLGVYFGSADFDTRYLTPYSHLKKGSNFKSTIVLDLLDSSIVLRISKELQSKSFIAFASTLAVALTSLIPIFSASLFYATWIPSVWSKGFELSGLNFHPAVVPISQGHTSILILMSNLSYPPFIYEDLIFPEISVVDDRPEGSYLANTSGLVTKLKNTAFRSRLECRLYNSSHIQTNLRMNSTWHNEPWSFDSTPPDADSYLSVEITEELCYGVNLVLPFNATIYHSSYFGGSSGGPGDSPLNTGGCSDWIWAWGYWNITAENPVTSVNALGCNETLDAIETDTTLLGAELSIDVQRPPIPDEGTSRFVANLPVPSYLYSGLIALPLATEHLAASFALATHSRYAIPVEYLSMDTKAAIVADALRFQHGIIRAQSINRVREDPKEPVDIEGADYITINSTQQNGTVTDAFASRRVIQDPTSTRIVQALLAATVLSSGLSWLLMGSTRIVPRRPTSIASVAALLADSNLFQYLPENTPWPSSGELARRFEGKVTFRLGWTERQDEVGESRKAFAIYVDPAIEGNHLKHPNPSNAEHPSTSQPIYCQSDVEMALLESRSQEAQDYLVTPSRTKAEVSSLQETVGSNHEVVELGSVHGRSQRRVHTI